MGLLDPSIKNNIKLDGIGGVCKTLKVNELSKNLLEALAENNRLGFTKAVVASFDTLMAAHRGEVVCTVTTAKELDAANKKEVEGALAGFLKSGEKALISYAVDPSIVGGMVVSQQLTSSKFFLNDQNSVYLTQSDFGRDVLFLE